MERIGLIGDIHFDRKAENPIIKKHIKEGQRKFFDFVINDFKNRGVKTVLMTGDIHDNRTVLDIESLVYTRNLLKEKFKDFDVHIILGNHDLYYENSYDISALQLLEDIPNVTIYRDKVVKKEFLGREWYLFPWIIEDRKEKFVDFLTKMNDKPIEKKEKTILFGHFEMLGVNMEGKNMSFFGLDPNLFFNAANMIISGHYHGPSMQDKSGSKLLYLGSLCPLTFINAGESHGVWILDEDMNLEFVNNTISPSFVDLWDTDIDKVDYDLTNSFVRFFINNDKTAEELLEINLKIDNKKPLIIKKIPYTGDKKSVEEKDSVQREANAILGMDIIRLSEVYIEENEESLPKLSSNQNSKEVVLEKIRSYKKELNL
jgi:DNA repair exonuclease SbcCD nuclease subunit